MLSRSQLWRQKNQLLEITQQLDLQKQRAGEITQQLAVASGGSERMAAAQALNKETAALKGTGAAAKKAGARWRPLTS